MQHKCRFEEAMVSLGKTTSSIPGFANAVVNVIFRATNEVNTLNTALTNSDTPENIGKYLGILVALTLNVEVATTTKQYSATTTSN